MKNLYRCTRREAHTDVTRSGEQLVKFIRLFSPFYSPFLSVFSLGELSDNNNVSRARLAEIKAFRSLFQRGSLADIMRATYKNGIVVPTRRVAAYFRNKTLSRSSPSLRHSFFLSFILQQRCSSIYIATPL